MRAVEELLGLIFGWARYFALNFLERALPLFRALVYELRLDAEQQSNRFAMSPAPYGENLEYVLPLDPE